MHDMVEPKRAIPIARPFPLLKGDRPEVVSFLTPDVQPDRRRLPLRLFSRLVSAVEWCFGLACVLVGLAILAAIPILQFLSLGYLLECGGRIARTGLFREGFIGIRLAGRLGGIVFASWLFLIPVRFVADLARSASIIDPGGDVAKNWRFALVVLMTATAAHILTAVANGGKFRHFLSPFNAYFIVRKIVQGGFYTRARDTVWDTLISLRLPYYFMLGFRGFLAAMLWLVVPVSLIALGRAAFTAAPLFGFLGALLLALVVIYLPFLQLRLAQTNRFVSAFNVLAVRREYSKAPWMFAFSFIVTLLFALPLYLLKIEVVPSEAAWLPSLVFILFIYPSRLLVGWAIARASRREKPRHWFFRWTGRIPFLPVVIFYVIVVFFTQYTSWNGIASLYEQHAFSLPVPFLGM